MKAKHKLSILVLLLVILILYIVVYLHNKSINSTIRGVNFRLGTEPIHNVQPETVRITGTVSKNLKGLRTFKGTVTFEHESIPVPKESRDVTIHFDKNGYGPIVYGYIENAGTEDARPKTFSDGVLFANADFSSITYLSRDGWDSEDGKMFAAPAATREEALILSNKLMKNFLKRDHTGEGSFVLN
ncbi:hypothetical protein GZH47_01450 [Paenibacillus rhizovicinus]|uniref:Uncharacterized protein n=1 Tax=Paenibacillus rhizovicinus TaxID=2704463 RepID=A0A6C0NTT1_9BACL|nr:hypothetical protein [Paenibacillus rhizovicinus]QHW29630.1 hypothetical protein GZH47_01450 [Paenibacillus rhizovicinus]